MRVTATHIGYDVEVEVPRKSYRDIIQASAAMAVVLRGDGNLIVETHGDTAFSRSVRDDFFSRADFLEKLAAELEEMELDP